MAPASPFAGLALPAVLALAAGLRLVALDGQPLWWDEGWSVYFASLPLGRMLAATALDIHPPLYYALLHLWTELLGFSPPALRLLSVFFGLALVLAVYLVGQELLGRRAGTLSALLVALAPLHVYYAQEVRMYAFVTALGALSWYALLRAERGGGKRWHVAYAVATAMALYTEYYAALLWCGQALYVALRSARNRRPLNRLAREWAYTLVPLPLYLPWLVYALPKLAAYVGAKRAIEGYLALDPLSYLWAHLSSFAAGQRVGPQQPWPLIAVTASAFLALAAVGLMAGRRNARLVALVVSYLGLPLGLGYAINAIYPFTPRFFERVLLFASPPLCLVAAAGLLYLARRTRFLATVAALLVLAPAANLYFVWTVPRYPQRDYRPVFATIRQLGSEHDRVLCLHQWQYGYAYAYLPQRLRHLYLAPVDSWESGEPRRAGVSDLLAQSARLWFPAHQSLGRVLEEEITTDLDDVGYRALAGWYGSETLLLAHAGRPPALKAGSAGAFDDGPVLVASELSSSTLAGGGAVVTRLSWQELDGGLEASLRLLDGQGYAWAARDFALDAPEQRLGLIVPWGTPATELTLALVVSRAGAELHPAGQPPGATALRLGTVSLLPPSELPPDAADLGLRRPAASFQPGPVLLGQQSLPPEVRQGDDLPVVLWWSATTPSEKEYVVFIQGLTDNGELAVAIEERVTGGAWPMTAWQPGALARDPHALLVPAHVRPGVLRFIAGLLDPETRQRLPVGNGWQVTLGDVRILAVERGFQRPPMGNTLDVPFGDLADLEGYTLSGCEPEPGGSCLVAGDALRVELVWRARAETGRRFRAFVHLLSGDRIVTQSDHQPGDLPTTAWMPGQYVLDAHVLDLTRLEPGEGPLTLAVGLYDPRTGERLVPRGVESRDGRLLLTEVARP